MKYSLEESINSIGDDIEELNKRISRAETMPVTDRHLYCSIAVIGITVMAKALIAIAIEMRQHRS